MTFDYAKDTYTDEAYSGTECHVPHGECDGEGEARVGEEPVGE